MWLFFSDCPSAAAVPTPDGDTPAAVATPKSKAAALFDSGDVCLTGFALPESRGAVQNGYVEQSIAGRLEAVVQPQIRQWMSRQKWQDGYRLWQESRRRNSFSTHNTLALATDAHISTDKASSLRSEEECGSAKDGYEFLVMHRYMLQTIKSIWPGLEDLYGGWWRFPSVDDYPQFLQHRVYAWPNSILTRVPENSGGGSRGGHGVAVVETPVGNPATRREEVLARWKNEGEFGQWLQCGATQNGLHPDSLYGALITNAMPFGDQQKHGQFGILDFYLFWKAHGWMDRMWEEYRTIIGKTPEDPELQAALIQQCRIHRFWSEKALTQQTGIEVRTSSSPRYLNGTLNPIHEGKMTRLLGEIVDIQQSPAGKPFFLLDARLVGVKPVWVSSFSPVAANAVRLGETYELVGTIAVADKLDASGQLRKFLQSPTLLLVKSIQSTR